MATHAVFAKFAQLLTWVWQVKCQIMNFGMHASGAHLANVKIVQFEFGEFGKASWFYVQRQLFCIDKTT